MKQESSLPLPPPWRGRATGTFAHHSVANRLPDIARRTLAENRFSPATTARVQTLIDEIPHGPIRPLNAADSWNQYVSPYVGQSWLDAPWFFVENYFYRRLLQETGHLVAGRSVGPDPFQYQKRQGLRHSTAAQSELAALVQEWTGRAQGRPNQRRPGLAAMLTTSLWGNQADLSLWPADAPGAPRHADGVARDGHALVDQSNLAAAHWWRCPPPRRLEILVDNAGFELVADLALTAFLLEVAADASVTLRVKAHPTFVSDATAGDVAATVTFLGNHKDEAVRWLWRRLQAAEGRWRIAADPFWTSPLPGWEMPAALGAALRPAALVISKGDAHYRRLLGDRLWAYTTPFVDVLAYFPAPLVALRTLKSEVAVGLTDAAVARAEAADADWLIDGRWGVIQFSQRSPVSAAKVNQT